MALDSERWKQTEISIDIQNLFDYILTSGLAAPHKKFDAANKTLNEFLLVNNEKYVIFASVIVLIKLLVEYCQFSMNMSNLSYDIMTRLIEIFNVNTRKIFLAI